MLGTITKGAYDNTPIPDNVYLAKLKKITEKAPPASHPEWYPSLSWQFQILQDPFKNRTAFGKTPTNWIQGKKLDNWLVAVGINASKGQSVKIEDVKDLYVKIFVKGKKYNDKQTGEEKIFSEVIELLPLDSLDQIKIRELAMTAPPAAVGMQPVATAPVTVIATHTFTPPASTVPVQPVPGQTFVPVQPTFTPAPNVTVPTGAPSRTIPF